MGVTNSGRTQNSVPSERMGKGFYGGKKKRSSCRLTQVVYQDLELEDKFLLHIQWVVKHISSLMREMCVFFSPEKLQLSALFFGFGNSATIQWLI